MTTAAVITISDTCSRDPTQDLSGPAADDCLTKIGIEVTYKKIIPDLAQSIQDEVRALLKDVTLIVTTGGTGIADRDITPETITPFFDKTLPGFGEIMRNGGFAKTPLSIVSRCAAGIAGRTLIVILPGNPQAVREGLALIGPAIKHVLKFLDHQPVDCRRDADRPPV